MFAALVADTVDLSGSFGALQFSIDNHTLTVVEAEGTSVEPIKVQSVTLAVAQRYSVLVDLDQTPGAYWIRNNLVRTLSVSLLFCFLLIPLWSCR